ncbi:hypothetical protein [Dyella sp. Tek66A03]|uniref:hypothetical protein n=1 Tax=Dyella sp. Tek66A03 TaxID=3458298 RepID=UPI00403E71D0
MFLCIQHDPRQGFIKILDKTPKILMKQFVTHIGGGVFACPPGVREGGYVGQTLFGVALGHCSFLNRSWKIRGPQIPFRACTS